MATSKTSLLMNEQPIVVSPTLAKVVGVNGAILLQQVHYWAQVNEKKGNNSHEGYTWVYNSYNQWSKQLPWLTARGWRKIIVELETTGFLITDNKPQSQTKWYRINYLKLEDASKDDPLSQSVRPPVTKCQTSLSQSVSPPCHKVSDPYTENTTESTTETTSKEKSLAPTGAVSATPSEAVVLQGDAEQASPATQSAPMPTPAPSTETPAGSAPTTPKKVNVWRAVVDHVWGQSTGSAFGNILLTQLTGTAKAGSRKAWRLETPATLEEILGFGRWWKTAHPNTDVPSKAETLYERVAEFRGSPQYKRTLELARAELPRFRGERVIVTPTEPVASPSEALVPPEQLADTYAELEKLMGGGL